MSDPTPSDPTLTAYDEALLQEALHTLDRLRLLHGERSFHIEGGGYGYSACAECRQAWPCQTVKVMNGAS